MNAYANKRVVFVDYTGTLVKEGGPYMQQIVKTICESSDLHTPQQAVSFWWQLQKEYEQRCFGAGFLTQDEIVERVLQDCARQIHLAADRQELHRCFQQFWVHAPIFPDVVSFFEQCPLPVYVLTNNGADHPAMAFPVYS